MDWVGHPHREAREPPLLPDSRSKAPKTLFEKQTRNLASSLLTFRSYQPGNLLIGDFSVTNRVPYKSCIVMFSSHSHSHIHMHSHRRWFTTLFTHVPSHMMARVSIGTRCSCCWCVPTCARTRGTLSVVVGVLVRSTNGVPSALGTIIMTDQALVGRS